MDQFCYSSSNKAEFAAECPREEIFFSKEVLTLQERDHIKSRRVRGCSHVQTDLSDFGDKIEMSDNDPAVVRTVENLSVAWNDIPSNQAGGGSQDCRRDLVPMNTDKALATCKFHGNLRCGDTGRGRVEHRSFEQLRFTLNLLKTGYLEDS